LVESIPADKLTVLLARELSETALGTAADDGQPLIEATFNLSAAAISQKLPRFGVAQPITLGVLDEPGTVAAILDRRIHFGIGLGLEADMLAGNPFWSGLLNVAGTIPVAKGAGFRVTALVNAVAAVQANGFYGPLQVAVHPTTRAAIFNETDTAGRPLPVDAMLAGQVDTWVISKFVPVGQAVVLDAFNSTALIVKGPLVLGASRSHADFLVRSTVEWTLSFRAFAWVRNPSSAAIVSGL
jgi:hypothetical protein